MPGRVVAHECDRVAVVRVGDHEGRLARPERHRGQYVKQLTVVMAVDLDDREPKRGGLLVERL
jgi:hypothetical protein